MLSREEAMGLVPAVEGSIMRSINDSSKRYDAPSSVSKESVLSFTWGLLGIVSVRILIISSLLGHVP